MMARVLIIDDDPTISYTLARVARRSGHEVDFARTLGEGRDCAQNAEYGAIFLDVILPDGDGLTLLPELAAHSYQPMILIITGAAEPDGAANAIVNGAWEYIQKSASISHIGQALERALRHREKQRAAAQNQEKPLSREKIVGNSPALNRALGMVEQYAASEVNVLITGETGVGKEMFARAIHNNSRRQRKPFVVVDCAALPETLAEGMLFGHCKGAFTGADRERKGLVLEADGGTLFLDEIGELSLELQKKFLRILQERTVRPLGGAQEYSSDFRLIAATNRNIEDMVAAETFRSDLLYRVKELHLPLPPLRERQEDIQELAQVFVDSFCAQYGLAEKLLDAELQDVLRSYSWPGNVRELRNAMNFAVTAARHEALLYSQHLPQEIRIAVTCGRMEASPARLFPLPESKFELPSLHDYRIEAYRVIESQYLADLMTLTQWNIKEACEISGLSRSRLYALLKEHKVLQNKTSASS
ncbi:sigma-54 dependent transcriptional regulator [Desulfobaculum bizertense]|uniref:sigma-54-dependent transcriptional regulator n=1 Tax=Desulfobaculum bizertense TaxID=376490 RepID=UPI001F485A40|nr:sigma-54 dependent transcriptional regulator [Desulfobaculum bizertense]UIJ38331.1 sigma-54 dependent transcriptional regulator [Desulfobaculum bizertense]